MKILTFDIEEWFHILDNPSTKSEKEWVNYESRIHKNMETIFEILDVSKASASFFVVGWIAEKYPEVVRMISDRGYEIGSHTHMHQLAYEQDRPTFYNDVERSIKTIEDCIGKKVELFRAPGFSISHNNKWAFEVLHELGITTDSSVFPIEHAHGGLKCFPSAKPSLIEYNGVTLKEFPINIQSIVGKSMVFSGGGYFRLLPYNFIKKATLKSDYIMSYFHPRDFDYKQPLIKDLSSIRRFKSYVGLKSCKPKLEKWLNDFQFMDISTANDQIDWNQKKVAVLD
ncbi:polysaccharide deacetylase family protein [Maribacter sp. MAR_2009_72]|uniref:polysaccharide deacetylase family protein n=1 Tax=Maribacter sp. MAR_2009_72 TaxID=1250050 RepID=UPI0011996A9E|nr:polysaccharide deacetylase family protein [Maribacter sp. MAR_2009_72]TVZ16919.1 polysaccharide deacetylase family protein (PEP-CTERM system associated) [Maribacter sp. MAR_2009_72]